MEKVRAFLNAISPIDETDWEFFLSRMESHDYKKKTILVKSEKVENYINYVEEGIIRYYIPKDENDVTFGFSFKDEIASAYDSFLTQQPCNYQVETLTDTKLWRISYSNLTEIYNGTNVGRKIGQLMAEGLFVKSVKRELSLLNKTAEERYLDLFTERPRLIEKIPLKYIASYIGITPQALSRIRNQIS